MRDMVIKDNRIWRTPFLVPIVKINANFFLHKGDLIWGKKSFGSLSVSYIWSLLHTDQAPESVELGSCRDRKLHQLYRGFTMIFMDCQSDNRSSRKYFQISFIESTQNLSPIRIIVWWNCPVQLEPTHANFIVKDDVRTRSDGFQASSPQTTWRHG